MVNYGNGKGDQKFFFPSKAKSSFDVDDGFDSIQSKHDFVLESFTTKQSESKKKGDRSANKSVTSDSPTLLYTYIKSGKWASVLKRCKSPENSKSEAETWIVEKNMDNSIRWKLLPIHQACENGAPSDVVKALLDAYPYAVKMKDSGGDLPLHLACRERCSKTVILTLLQANPEASSEADGEGRLPLHLACRQGVDIDVIDKLIVCYHRAVQTPDSYSLLPLHWACAQNSENSVIQRLLRANPHAVKEKDKWGRTPLSLVVASTNPEKDKIMDNMNKNPSFWTTTLLNEIGGLKSEVQEKETAIQNSENMASSLEAKLAEVTQASSLAAQSFRELNNEIELENESLKKKIEYLTKRNESSETLIKGLRNDNEKVEKRIKDMCMRLDSITSMFRFSEGVRMQILKVTGEMEDTLQKASEIIGDDHDMMAAIYENSMFSLD